MSPSSETSDLPVASGTGCGDMLRDSGVPILSPAHHAMLAESSKINPRVMGERGYFTLRDKRELPKYGFAAYGGNVPCLAIPQYSPDGKTITYSLRIDNPQPDKEGKVHKYLQASGVRLVVDVNPIALGDVKNPDVPLWITEGAKKADAAISHGVACVSISGVFAWRNKTEPLPCWEYIPLRGREVVIAFDSDVMTKPSVYNALKRFSSFLRGRGADVRYLYLPQENEETKVGIDDFLAAGNTVDDLKALVSSELKPPQTIDGELSALDVSDVDNAERFAARFGEDFRFVQLAGKWFHWNGKQWNHDERGVSVEKMKETIAKIFYEAAACGNEFKRDALIAGAKKCRSVMRIQGALTMAKTLPVFSTVFDDYDANPFRLNCANGILTMDTQTIDPHDPADMMTKLCPAPYDKTAKCPKWNQFLERILPDPEVRLFVQKAVGYSLTGSTDEQCFFFCYGEGANGKSVFLSVLERLAADYGVRVPVQTILKDKYNNSAEKANPQLAKLRGARVVMTSEIPAQGRLNDELVKDLTGGDRISCRELYGDPFTFTPQLTLWLYGNHKPQIAANDDGIWRRVRLIPFTQRIPAEERIPGLDKQLFEELPGILRWAIEGFALWRKEGLKPPKAIEDAGNEYRQEEDALAAFIEYGCLITGDEKDIIKKGDLWSAYEQYGKHHDEMAYRTQRAFNKDVKRLSGVLETRASDAAKAWSGIKLNPNAGNDSGQIPPFLDRNLTADVPINESEYGFPPDGDTNGTSFDRNSEPPVKTDLRCFE